MHSISIDVKNYILSFLLGTSDKEIIDQLYYGKNPETAKGKFCILQSNFFDEDVYGLPRSYPQIPLKEWRDIPILFGEPYDERENGNIIIHADLVASTYFMISRYEELINKQRDEHGRFPAIYSLPYKEGFIDRPIIDEYRKELRAIVGLPPIKKGFIKIWLTHDVDIPWEHFTFLSAIKRCLGNLKREKKLYVYPMLNHFGKVQYDPFYTFPKIMVEDNVAKSQYGDICRIAYFILSSDSQKPFGASNYISERGIKKLLRDLRHDDIEIGLHTSYESGERKELIEAELTKLQNTLNKKVKYNRNHYLNSRDINSYFELIKCGITDDFTMGFADKSGFRLGTCHPVKWICPNKIGGELTDLVLHPLEIMECTLTSDCYMGLSLDDAYSYSVKLIKHIYDNNGELCLLWHNQSLMDGKVELELYKKIIDYLINIHNKEGNII